MSKAMSIEGHTKGGKKQPENPAQQKEPKDLSAIQNAFHFRFYLKARHPTPASSSSRELPNLNFQ